LIDLIDLISVTTVVKFSIPWSSFTTDLWWKKVV